MPTATIELAALSHNVARIRSYLVPGTRVLAAVKANAYGHGALPVARHLASLGVGWFGVATLEEALELREGGVQNPILIFSPVYEGINELVDQEVRLCVADERSLTAILQADLPKPVNVHLKVDTGMGRLGLPPQAALALAQKIDAHPSLELEGVWTHFAKSDEEARQFTECQIEAFQDVLTALKHEGVNPEIVHSANSAAIFAYPDAQFDMVRPGIALYGYHSSPYIAGLELELRPTMTLSAPITFVKRVKAGTPISYGALWHAPKDTTVATVRIGYADGYPRLLSNKAEVVMRGEVHPVAGRVCMDQLMVDVGEMDVQVGERATLFGPGKLDAETLAARIGTISYELLTSVSPRVERVYL